MPPYLFNRRTLLKEGKTETNPFGDRIVWCQKGKSSGSAQVGGSDQPGDLFYFGAIHERPAHRPARELLTSLRGRAASGPDFGRLFCHVLRPDPAIDRSRCTASAACWDSGQRPVRRREQYRWRKTRRELCPGGADARGGRRRAHEVARVHRTLRFHDGVELKAAAAELELKRRHPTPELVARAGSCWRVRPAPRPFTSAKRRMPSARWMRRTGRIK